MYNLFGNYTKKTLYSPLPFFVINEGTQGSHHVVLKEFKISHPPSPPRPSSLSLHHYPWLPFIASIYPCFLSPPYSVAFALCVYPWTDIHLRSLFFPQLVLTFQLSPCSAPPPSMPSSNTCWLSAFAQQRRVSSVRSRGWITSAVFTETAKMLVSHQSQVTFVDSTMSFGWCSITVLFYKK